MTKFWAEPNFILSLICSILVFATGLTMPASSAQSAKQLVSLELVLAIDVSFSVSDSEYDLQMRGTAEALRQPEVIQLIGARPGGVAVALVQWAAWPNEGQGRVWWHLTDRASVEAFAGHIELVGRADAGPYTGIGDVMKFSIHLLETNEFSSGERKIDISGDGRSNSGVTPDEVRIIARALGVSINGLAVMTDDPNLDKYYRSNVVSGPNSFVMVAADYDHFKRAMKIKLIRELTLQLSQERLTREPLERQARLH